ncbi:Mss4-like protein [Trichoderma austrokoningii]
MSDQVWKTKPPYQKPDQAFHRVLQGACHCSQVKYWLSKDSPLASKYCHCGDCKVIHGAPFQWAAIFQKSDMAFENGAENLRFYNSGSKSLGHELPCKVSCSQCGTLIMDEGRNMVLLFPTLLKFQNETQKRNFDVQCHIFYPQRVVDIPDGKPKWAGLDGKSELVPET